MPGALQPLEPKEEKSDQLLRRSSQESRKKTKRMWRAGNQMRNCFKGKPVSSGACVYWSLSISPSGQAPCLFYSLQFIQRESGLPGSEEKLRRVRA